MRFLALVPIALLASAAVAAEDPDSGLGVTLPADYAVEAMPPPRGASAAFGVKFASGDPVALEGEPYLCQVSYEPVPGNAGLTQESINSQIGSPDWMTMARNAMSANLALAADTTFMLDGYKGVEFIGTPTQKNSEDIRLVISSIETALGRTAIACATSADRLDSDLTDFRAIRDGVTLPQ